MKPTPCPSCPHRPGCGPRVIFGTRGLCHACRTCKGSGYIGPRMIRLVTLCRVCESQGRRWTQ